MSKKPLKLMLDASIIAEAAQSDRQTPARLLLMLAYVGEIQAYAPATALMEASRLLKKSGLSPEAAKEKLRRMMDLITVADCGAADIENCLGTSAATDIPLDLLLLASCARRYHVHAVIAEDADSLKPHGIPAYTASEFFAMLKERYGLVYAEMVLPPLRVANQVSGLQNT